VSEQELWNAVVKGESKAAAVRRFDTALFRCKIGCEVEDAGLKAGLDRIGVRPADRALDMAMLASDQALRQAGLIQGTRDFSAQPIGVLMGTGIGCSQSLYDAYQALFQKGPKGLRPSTVPRCMANAISGRISMHFRLTGPNYVIVSACTSSTVAMGLAFRMIRDGYAERVLCGGTDAVFDPAQFGGWDALGVMSCNTDAARACRPFDAKRDGCVLGEGAGALLLESAESARARGAKVRAEIAGYGESSDAGHITAPDPEGQRAAMVAALESAAIRPSDIGWINAHGTATRANDECECRSIRATLNVAANDVPTGSSKAIFGHLLGAAGVMETIVAILAIENGIVPPSVNLETPDAACDVRLAGSQPEPMRRPVVMKNSFGFGGNNGVLILKQFTK
jgi:3-oxoacyl-[acyl-carrier-protein] synthase II